jgi:two-component system sensor histidine kinase KdpD
MNSGSDLRPDPDALLRSLKLEEENATKGKLKIFLGMSAGVGKTYDMLAAAHEACAKGLDVVVGFVETHGRQETEALLKGLTILPRKALAYRANILEEMDLDAILARKPQLVLVDELAHTNAPGSRHTKRYMDVQELLDNGIDVYSTLNVQHLESCADTVAQITGSAVRETIPDSMIEGADDVELVDLPPDELLRRLREGKVYTAERSRRAIENFFRKGNLTALREMALRVTTERVERQLREYMRSKHIRGPWKTGQRLLVGISPSPHGADLLRWARRMAATMNASWVATFVESSQSLSEAEQERLERNMKLARELGAEIVTTSDESVAEALLRVARQENCSQILIGKPRPGFFGAEGNLLREVLRKSGDLDVHVIGGEAPVGTPAKRAWPPVLRSDVRQYSIVTVIVFFSIVILSPLARMIGYQTVALILLFVVAVLPLRYGIGPVLLGAALSALGWDYFFIPPLYTFSIGRIEDVAMLIMYFCIASVTSVMTSRTRAQERAVRIREQRAVAQFTLSRDLAEARTKDAVVAAAVRNIGRVYDAKVVVYLGQTDGDVFTTHHPQSSWPANEKEQGVASWVYWNERKAGRNTDTLPSAEASYFPISGPRYPLGVIGLRLNDDHPLKMEQEALLESFIRQIASALERETLNEIAQRSIVVQESERLYNTLFNSISHEMRTPISAIIGASESLDSTEEGGLRKELLSEIHTAAERLNRLVENLLDMTRLESGLIRPKLEWCDIHDLVVTAIRKTSKELGRHSVTVDVAPDLPPVRMDFVLMEQVMTNLLLNASMYTPAGTAITVTASVSGGECMLSVADDGPGLPPGAEEMIFDKFYRVPGSNPGGTGLGLSIVRGFVAAHNGTVKAARRTNGGTEFVVRIPVEPPPESELHRDL